jgi:nucleotide-binding universal stress UspA family protein
MPVTPGPSRSAAVYRSVGGGLTEGEDLRPYQLDVSILHAESMNTNKHTSRVIVVGVDGSESSLDALEWAAGQARLVGASLEAVAAWEWPTSYGWAPAWPSDWNPAAEADLVLRRVVEKVLGSDSDVEVKIHVEEGHPAQILLKVAETADLLVVGSRGHGAFTGMLLGSVSEHCVSHAVCPVVVVRHRQPTVPVA